jgi:hypothetical protein
MTDPGQRDLQAEQDHAEWRGWMKAQGYAFDDDSYQAEAFAAGMEAQRDLDGRDEPAPDATPATADGDARNAALRADRDQLRECLHRIALGRGIPALAADQALSASRTLAASGCLVCAEVGGPHGVPQAPPTPAPASPEDPAVIAASFEREIAELNAERVRLADLVRQALDDAGADEDTKAAWLEREGIAGDGDGEFEDAEPAYSDPPRADQSGHDGYQFPTLAELGGEKFAAYPSEAGL